MKYAKYFGVMAEPVFNSSPPSATYVPQWIGSALSQIMAWRLFRAKPLSKPMLVYCHTHRKKLQWNLNQNTKLFIHKNASENIVCEMAAILLWGRWDKVLGHPLLQVWILGAVSIRKTVLPGMAIPMLKIRRPNGRLIFNMEIAIHR